MVTEALLLPSYNVMFTIAEIPAPITFIEILIFPFLSFFVS